MTGRVKSVLAGAALDLLFILDRAERRKLDRQRAAKNAHWDEIAKQNRATISDRIAGWVIA